MKENTLKQRSPNWRPLRSEKHVPGTINAYLLLGSLPSLLQTSQTASAWKSKQAAEPRSNRLVQFMEISGSEGRLPLWNSKCHSHGGQKKVKMPLGQILESPTLIAQSLKNFSANALMMMFFYFEEASMTAPHRRVQHLPFWHGCTNTGESDMIGL